MMRGVVFILVCICFQTSVWGDETKPPSQPEPKVFDRKVLERFDRLKRLQGQTNEALWDAVRSYSFDLGFPDPFSAKFSPRRDEYLNPKLTNGKLLTYTVIDSVNIKLELNSPGLGPLGVGFQTGLTLTHFRQLHRLTGLTPFGKEVAMRLLKESLEADTFWEDARQSGLEKFIREKDLGFDYLFKGIESGVKWVMKPFSPKDENKRAARYDSFMNPYRLLFKVPWNSKEILKPKYSPGDVVSGTAFGRLSAGASLGNVVSIDWADLGAFIFLDTMYRYTVVKETDRLVRLRVQPMGVEGGAISGSLKARVRLLGGIIGNGVSVGFTPFSFEITRSKLKAMESEWEMDLGTKEGREAYDAAIHGVLWRAEEYAAKGNPSVKWVFTRATGRMERGARVKFNFFLVNGSSESVTQVSRVHLQTPDGEFYYSMANANMGTNTWTRWFHGGYERFLHMSDNARTDKEFKEATAERLSLRFWVYNEASNNKEMEEDLDIVKDLTHGMVSIPHLSQWSGPTHLEVGMEFDLPALQKLRTVNIDYAWSLLAKNLKLKPENQRAQVLDFNIEKAWRSQVGRDKWLNQLSEVERNAPGRIGDVVCKSTMAQRRAPCRNMYIFVADTIKRLEDLQRACDLQDRLDRMSAIFHYTGSSPWITSTIFDIVGFEDGVGIKFQISNPELAKLYGKDDFTYVSQVGEILDPFDLYNPDETLFTDTMGDDAPIVQR